MFSEGTGQKWEPDVGMLVVKIGGPAYGIGMRGGAASSMASGQNDADLDFNADNADMLRWHRNCMVLYDPALRWVSSDPHFVADPSSFRIEKLQ
ncbi:hypothetical protein OIU77_012557 [Salix suchowensis]|uniref:Uncharacterized protein n=1 Tax=Salix suchowensis TaxID=1278906 RepID=A0ABQ9A5V2_9ROSI|nr:hypothetical protein OIU77_012557 [Salix suchowensis]